MEQTSLIDGKGNPSESILEREKALQVVEDSARVRDGANWPELALDAVRRCPFDRFTTEELREWAVDAGIVEPPSNPKAWGAVMMKAARSGIIEKTGDYKQKHGKACHACPAVIWRMAN